MPSLFFSRYWPCDNYFGAYEIYYTFAKYITQLPFVASCMTAKHNSYPQYFCSGSHFAVYNATLLTVPSKWGSVIFATLNVPLMKYIYILYIEP